MRAVVAQVEEYADGDAPVLICGEHGTGRELVARVLHQRGPRTRRPVRRGAADVRGRPTCRASPATTPASARAARCARPRAARCWSRTSATCRRRRSARSSARSAIAASERDGRGVRRPRRRDRRPRCRSRGRRARSSRASFYDLFAAAPHRGAAAARSRSTICRRCSSAGSSTTPPRSAARKPTRLDAARIERLAAYPWPGNVAELKSIARRLVVRVDAQPGSRPAMSTRSCRSSPTRVPLEDLAFEEMVKAKLAGLLARIDGYPVHDLYEKVARARRAPAVRPRARAHRRQPAQGGRDPRAQSQHAAQEARGRSASRRRARSASVAKTARSTATEPPSPVAHGVVVEGGAGRALTNARRVSSSSSSWRRVARNASAIAT